MKTKNIILDIDNFFSINSHMSKEDYDNISRDFCNCGNKLISDKEFNLKCCKECY